MTPAWPAEWLQQKPPAPATSLAAFARRVLLALCGLTPQIVTETLYALAANGNAADARFVSTEFHLITTAEGALRWHD